MRTKMEESKRSAIKEKMLQSAEGIVEEEGFEGISMREVAKRSGYTPGSIYQYFENKDVLIRELIKSGYKRIMKAINQKLDEKMTIEEQIIQRFTSYIGAALNMREYYKAVMFSEDPKIIEMTAVLHSEESHEQRGINKLEKAIEKGMERGEFLKGDPTIIAKICWTANYGLLLRIIIEDIQDKKVIQELIQEQFRLLFQGLRKKEIIKWE
ncbi:TetR/AcrR family transcriptional regulator [Isachenkonia alkalipeptolytica]|nr:TetR/AcrR family transcriptional regulator [Isachenkonia alkalipeptolytica]